MVNISFVSSLIGYPLLVKSRQMSFASAHSAIVSPSLDWSPLPWAIRGHDTYSLDFSNVFDHALTARNA